MPEYESVHIRQASDRLPSRLALHGAGVGEWKSLRIATRGKTTTSATFVDFAPEVNGEASSVAVVCGGTKASFIDLNSFDVLHTINKFKSPVQCCRFRKDGRLVIASEESGTVQVFDWATRNSLRKLKIHKSRVRQCCFANENTSLFTAGDDFDLHNIDLSSGKIVDTIRNTHTDAVVSCLASPSSCKSPTSSVFASMSRACVTASYDGLLKLWDFREGSGEAVKVVDHGAPIEAICLFPSRAMVATAGANRVCVWDLSQATSSWSAPRKTDILVDEWERHFKTVTGVSVSADGRMMMTSSADQTIKVMDLYPSGVEIDAHEQSADSKCRVLHSFKDEHIPLVLAARPNFDGLLYGCDSGDWVLRMKDKAAVNLEEGDTWGAFSRRSVYDRQEYTPYFWRGRNAEPKEHDTLVDQTGHPVESQGSDWRDSKTVRLTNLLKSFDHRKCVDESMKLGISSFLAVADELSERGALAAAFQDRDPDNLSKVLDFINHYFCQDPTSTRTLLCVISCIIDSNPSIVGINHEGLLKSLRKLGRTVGGEITCQIGLLQLQGLLPS